MGGTNDITSQQNLTIINAPLYPQAVILPAVAFPSWVLCVPPLIWHFRQGNIAAASLILWCIIINFFNSINPLIWPRDNFDDWWNGNVWCDIHVRIQVGAVVGTTASAVMIIRKLARVMDTSNITISTSRNQKMKEKALEIFFCWGYPLIMILLYYIVQPTRYAIYGIVGCLSSFDPSWPSIVLSFMWAPITICVAGVYACILSYRLYRYRREFLTLISARNTTKSRFIRLFVICLIVIAVYVPYTTWLLFMLCRAITDTYSWDRVHHPSTFNTILKVPALGQVTVDRWGQVATGYVLFFVFGTGKDAENTFRDMALALGLGRCFPGLHERRESGHSTLHSFIAARSWSRSLSSRAKSMFWNTRTDSVDGSAVAMKSLGRVTTEERGLHPSSEAGASNKQSFFARLFARNSDQRSFLPIFSRPTVTEMTDIDTGKLANRDHSPGASAHAWATDKSSSRCVSECDGVHVVRESRLTHAGSHGNIEICGNEQFTLGRDPACCRYVWPDDLTISRRHLRVHCILYDQEPDSLIAPFVYATNLSVNGTYLKKSNRDCAGSQGRGILMGCNTTFLLDQGDELVLSETVRLVFSSAKPIQKAQFTPLQEREMAIFSRDYLITGRLLGEGGYGRVLIGIDQATQRQLACKMVRLDLLYDKVVLPNLRQPSGLHEQNTSKGRKRWPTRVAACFREFDILKDLNHPNIVHIEKVFWSNSTIYIFQELVAGGDLFSFLEYKCGRLDNPLAVVIIRQVLIGLEYLHEQDIVHRDLKPDNILMTSLDDGARVVITDFGNARFLPETGRMSRADATKCQRMFSYVGTLEYAAPEIHRVNPTIPEEEGYSKSVDMWSIGTVTATVLTGDQLFTDRRHPRYHDDPRMVIMDLAAACDLSIIDEEYHPRWSEVEAAAKDLIKSLLVLDEDERLTVTQALAHSWFSNETYAEDLEDVYDRSIADWQPRQMSSQLVERISKSLPDLTAVGLPGQAITQATVSRFFHPSEHKLTQNILQTLSASQHWRASTPLPSITEDYDN
ncbi:kinase-like protein, partial [Setomelanomma holmii]